MICVTRIFTLFRIEDAQYATPSPLITAYKVGVSQGSSGTDVPAFVNEKMCKNHINNNLNNIHSHNNEYYCSNL